MAADEESPVSVPDTSATGPPAAAKAGSKKKHTAGSYALAFLIKASVTVLAAFIVFTRIARIDICHINSAYPSIRDGDFCLTYRLAALKQGSMIVYRQDGKTKFGRVIAFGGDKVEIFEDFIAVNDYGLSEDEIYAVSPEGSAISYPYYVPENCVFVLNEYRSDVSDSRTCGGIPLDSVYGAVVFIMRIRGI